MTEIEQLYKDLNPEGYYKERCDKMSAKLDEVHREVLKRLFEHYDGCGRLPTLLECERAIDNWPEE